MSKRFQIFESGGMSGLTEEEYKKWRTDFKKELYSLYDGSNCKYKPYVISPPDYYDLDDDQLEAMNWDIYQIKHSDLLLVNFNAPKSIGTAMEIAIAKENGVPVVGIKSNKELHPWLLFNVDKMCSGIEQAAAYIYGYYLT